jgi:hypothetical protein
MKLIVLLVIILFIGSSSWFWHLKGVEDQKKKTETCLKQSAEDLKAVRVGLDSQLNQQELDKVNQKFQTCIST